MKATIFFPLILAAGFTTVAAQKNPALYFRVTKCNNIRSTVFVNDKQILSGSCGDGLSWFPVMFNGALTDSKNKLRLDLKNEREGDYYGALTFELLAADVENQSIRKFYTTEVKLQDFDRFQMGIDNLVKKQGWAFGNVTDLKLDNDLVRRRNRKDSIDYFFDKHDRFYIVITAAKRASYSVSINDQKIMEGSLHISALDDAYALKSYPYFFLNSFDKSMGKAVLTYRLEPQQGRDEAFLEIAIQHYAPYAIDPQLIAISKITCGKDEVKAGEFDITEPLRRHGYFNP